MEFDPLHIKVRYCEHAYRCSEDEFGEHYRDLPNYRYLYTDLIVILIVNLYPFRMIETSYSDII